jgi:hypothetical protein
MCQSFYFFFFGKKIASSIQHHHVFRMDMYRYLPFVMATVKGLFTLRNASALSGDKQKCTLFEFSTLVVTD